MKTCKKTLSLVLVFALVLSVFTYSASADFTDQDEITYEEAAVVLEALGVIDGYEDGSYQPDVVLSREEAAAIIARMKLGGSADNLTAGSEPFSDVSTDRWSAGYIAYCVSEGIVDGFEDGTFRPEEELTCYQFAKMLLVALGYDADSEGLTGDSWATNTVSYAVNAGIFDDISSYSGSADRDTVAQMAFNTLLADLVEYPSGNIIIDSGDTSIVINGSGASRIENTSSTDGNIDGDEDGDGYYQFAERYFTDLELVAVDEGDYGRPTTYNWELDGDVIYTGTDSDALLETYTGYVTKGTLYSLIGSSAYSDITNSDPDDGELKVYVDGVPYGVESNGDIDNTDTTVDPDYVDNFIDRSSSSYTEFDEGGYLTGTGVQTEVYLTDNGDVYIVCINVYLAEAVDDYDEDDGTLEVEYYCDSGTPDPADGDDITLEDDEFDIDGYVEGDYLLLTFDDGEVATAEAATVISGTVTGYTASSSITLDGTRYYYASNIDTETFELTGFAIDSDITLILNDFGYIVGYTDSTSSSNYLYVLEIAQTGSLSSSGYEAAVIFSDGTYDEIDLRYSYFIDEDGYEVDYDTGEDSQTGWYSYTVNSSGRYSLTEASSSRVEETTDADAEVRNGYVRYLTIDGTIDRDFTATSSTVFVVYNVDDDDFDVYTGYDEVPDVSGIVGVSAVTNSNGYSTAVMIFVDDDSSVTGGGTSSDFILIYSDDDTSVDSDNNTYYTYDAFVNGEPTTVDSSIELYSSRLYTDISYDDYGYIDEADAISKVTNTDSDEYVALYWGSNSKSGPTIVYSSGVISIGLNGVIPLADDYDIYLVDPHDEDYDDVTATRLANNYSDSDELDGELCIYGIYDDDGYVVTLYVVQDGILDI